MKPDSKRHRPTDAEYVRKLIERAGVSQREAARILGVTDRSMRNWCAGEPIPYTAQFALECLAAPD